MDFGLDIIDFGSFFIKTISERVSRERPFWCKMGRKSYTTKGAANKRCGVSVARRGDLCLVRH